MNEIDSVDFLFFFFHIAILIVRRTHALIRADLHPVSRVKSFLAIQRNSEPLPRRLENDTNSYPFACSRAGKKKKKSTRPMKSHVRGVNCVLTQSAL